MKYDTDTLFASVPPPPVGGEGRPPLFSSCVAAGFPSPADNYIERTIDLNAELVRHPAATFFLRVSGNSMVDARIHDGDVLVVDRALPPVAGRVVVAAVDGELTVKRLCLHANRLTLAPANPAYPVIAPAPESDVTIWGTVTYVIHKL